MASSDSRQEFCPAWVTNAITAGCRNTATWATQVLRRPFPWLLATIAGSASATTPGGEPSAMT